MAFVENFDEKDVRMLISFAVTPRSPTKGLVGHPNVASGYTTRTEGSRGVYTSKPQISCHS